MAPHKFPVRTRMKNVAEYLIVAACFLQHFQTPRSSDPDAYLAAEEHARLLHSLGTKAQAANSNKTEYAELLEDVCRLVHGCIIPLLTTTAGVALSPEIAYPTNNFIAMLRKISTCVVWERSGLKHLLLNTHCHTQLQLRACRADVQEVMAEFNAAHGSNATQLNVQDAHEELLSSSRFKDTAATAHTAGRQPVSADGHKSRRLKRILGTIAQESIRTAYWITSRFQAHPKGRC